MVVTTQYLNEVEECDGVALISTGRLVALAPPEALRRLATQGDIVEVQTRAPFDPSRLAGLAAVRGVRQIEDTLLHVTLDEAGTNTRSLIEAIEGGGAEIVWVREYRPSMDDVFAELVARDRALREAAAEAA